MNQWPKVKLRVIEGWDEDYRHSINSLHYEGRAVDITTSDKDKTKYGMLARLAVEAGFDWVHYESRSHVHCSVRSERADDVRNNGCFDGQSLVETPMGPMEMSQLQTHDMVLTMNSRGELQYSPVLMWLDRAEQNTETFVELQTKSGHSIRLTSSHLIYVADEPVPGESSTTPESHNSVMPSPMPDDLNANKSTGNNYYYYDTIVGAKTQHNQLQMNLASSESDKATTPDKSASTSNELYDYIYATYARNALVGQYLLITNPHEQVEFESSTNPGTLVNDRERISASRLTFNKPGSTLGHNAHHRHRRVGHEPRRSQTSLIAQTKTQVKFDEIVAVNFTTSQGIYAPLTREGNIVVNSIVASCYAVISDHDLAHLSMAPVRWFSFVYEKIFGLYSETPAYERTVEFLKRRMLYERLGTSLASPDRDYRIDSRETPNHQTNNSLDRTTKQARHIHWYPILLYNIARFVLPTAYLY